MKEVIAIMITVMNIIILTPIIIIVIMIIITFQRQISTFRTRFMTSPPIQ